MVQKIDKFLAKLTKRRKEKTWFHQIRDENCDAVIDAIEIQSIIREQSYKNKLENLHEIDKFLGIYDLQKLDQEDIKNLKILVTINEF
jgi:hypothetical protein